MSKQTTTPDYDMVDLIAQAVIDRLEERDRMNRLADVVLERIARIQTQTTLAAQAPTPTETPEDKADGGNDE